MNLHGAAAGRATPEGRALLIVGGMRTGTSWVSEVLGRTRGVSHLHEPDNPWEVPYAARAMVGMGALPLVEPGSRPSPEYVRLWDVAFGAPRGWIPNRRRSLHNSSVPNRFAPSYWLYRMVPYEERTRALDPGSQVVPLRFRLATQFALPASAGPSPDRVVKSVYAALALEWLVERYHPRVLLVRRHPLDALASQVKLGWGGDRVDERGVKPRIERWGSPPFPEHGDHFDRQVWLIGFTHSAYDELLAAHPEYSVVDHEDLCTDPLAKFKELTELVGLTWSSEAEEYLAAANRPGDDAATNRVASEQSGKWRKTLSAEQIERATELLTKFPVARRYAELG